MSYRWCHKESFQSFSISLICIYIKQQPWLYTPQESDWGSPKQVRFICRRGTTTNKAVLYPTKGNMQGLVSLCLLVCVADAQVCFACTHSLSYILIIAVSIYASQKTYRNKVWKYWAPTERQKRMLAKESRICKVCYKCQFSNFKQCCQNNFKLPLWFFPHRNAYTRRKLAVHLALGFASTVKLLECFKRDRGRDHYIYKTVLWKNNNYKKAEKYKIKNMSWI